jgi:tryptophan-rich sensory protein
MKRFIYVIVAIAICLFVGWLSSLLNMASIAHWYPTLVRSSLTPPDVVFPVVWGILYVLIGISAGLLYGVHDISKRLLLWLFAIQLLLNVSWNFFFFYMQSPILGFVNLLVLDVLGVAYFIGTLWIRRASAYFFLPYLLWLVFASYLNMYIMIFN